MAATMLPPQSQSPECLAANTRAETDLATKLDTLFEDFWRKIARRQQNSTNNERHTDPSTSNQRPGEQADTTELPRGGGKSSGLIPPPNLKPQLLLRLLSLCLDREPIWKMTLAKVPGGTHLPNDTQLTTHFTGLFISDSDRSRLQQKTGPQDGVRRRSIPCSYTGQHT
ncbi:Hypothetical predicted protein, partial [Pelobates cultripes]